MPQYDLPPDELPGYRCAVDPPADLAPFWAETLAVSRGLAARPQVSRTDCGLSAVTVDDVTFSGFGGHPVKAWLRRPAGVGGALPVVVKFNGYGGGRNLAHQVPFWTLAGYATLDVDNRGQGWAGGYVGDTAEVDVHTTGPSWLSRGLTTPRDHHLRRLYTDAVLAVDAVRTLPGVDPDRVAVTGVSQGGGIALAVSGLTSGLRAVLADVPFLCDFPRGVALAAAGPYLELAHHLAVAPADAAQVWRTLAYLDAAVLVAQATAPTLMSVALMDRMCPPSTVYGAFHRHPGPKELVVYPYNDHEGGQFHQEAVQLDWLRRVLPPT